MNAVPLAAAAAVLAATCAAAAPAAAAPVEEVILRPSAPPSALARERMERWHRAWREEAAAVERSFAALARAPAESGAEELRPLCMELARELLGLDRGRVLPVPDRAADLHLRRGLEELARAASTCLARRPYAARHALSEAARAFRQVDRLLAGYGLEAGAYPQASSQRR